MADTDAVPGGDALYLGATAPEIAADVVNDLLHDADDDWEDDDDSYDWTR